MAAVSPLRQECTAIAVSCVLDRHGNHRSQRQLLAVTFILIISILPFGEESDIEISCLFTDGTSTFHKDSMAHLCCNYSQLVRYSPSVFINGSLQGVSTVDKPGCRIVYVLRLSSYHNGLEIAVAYGTQSIGRWNATLHVESVNSEDVSRDARYLHPTCTCSSTTNVSVETGLPYTPDENPTHSSSQGLGQSVIWIAISAGVAFVICAVNTCTVIIVCAVVKRWHQKKGVARGIGSGESKAGQPANDQHTLSRSTSFLESDHVHSVPSTPSETEGVHQFQHIPITDAPDHEEMDEEDIQLQHNPAYEPLPWFLALPSGDQHDRVVTQYSLVACQQLQLQDESEVTEMQPNPAYISTPL